MNKMPPFDKNYFPMFAPCTQNALRDHEVRDIPHLREICELGDLDRMRGIGKISNAQIHAFLKIKPTRERNQWTEGLSERAKNVALHLVHHIKDGFKEYVSRQSLKDLLKRRNCGVKTAMEIINWSQQK